MNKSEKFILLAMALGLVIISCFFIRDWTLIAGISFFFWANSIIDRLD